MWRRHRWIAILLTSAVLSPSTAYAANTQSKRVSSNSDIRVVAVTPDSSGNFVLLSTSRSRQLGFPTIRYMPSGDGHSIMTVDFAGAIFQPQQAAMTFANSKVHQMRIGQLQQFPPIMRISMVADSTDAFGHVDFRSAPGSLTIKLPEKSYAVAPPSSAPLLPRTALAPPTTALAPPTSALAPPTSAPAFLTAAPAPPTTAPAPPATAPAPATTAPAVPTTAPARPRTSLAPPTTALAPPTTAPALRTTAPALPATAMPRGAPDKTPRTKTQTPIAAEAAAGAAASDAKYLPWMGDDEPPKPAPEAAPPGKLKRFFHKLFSHDNREPEAAEAPGQPAQPPTTTPPAPKLAPAIARKQPAAKQSTKSASPATITTSVASAPIRVSGSAGPDRFWINIASTVHFTYRTFRLANPDRLVVDITGIDQPSLQVAPIAENSYIKGLRVGNPDHNTNLTRIVCDLATAQIADSTAPQDGPNNTALKIILQKEPNATAANMPPVAPDLAAIPKALHAGMTVVLDAGHGGTDPGAQRGDIQEKAITLDIVEKLRRALESKNVKCYLTRSGDAFVSLEERVRITNQLNPDAFVSIHINSLETNNGTTGIETYYQTDRSKDLAALIHASLVKGLAAPDRGVRKARFYVINHTPVPAILAEVGFISNKDERDKLISSDYQVQIASAVADGVILYLSGTTHNASSSGPTGFTQNLQTAKVQPLQSKQKRLAATRSL